MNVARRVVLATTTTLLLAAPAAHAAAGDLDPSFGGDGVVQVQPGSRESELNALALSGDRVLAVGTEYSDSDCSDETLVRWLADGTPDPAYGTGGVAVTPTIQCRQDFPHFVRPLALDVAPDGSAITGGDAAGQGIGDGEMVTAHTAKGALDSAFGRGAGFVRHDDYFHGNVNALVRLPDGRIAAAGLHYGIRNAWGLSRYEADGDRDASFGGGDGFVLHQPFGGQGSIQGAVPDGADGALVVAGDSWGRTTPAAPTIGRFLADGSLDPSFGDAGLNRVSLDGGLMDIAETADGGFVAVGNHWDGSRYGWLLLKFDAAGDLDETFGAMGRVDGPAGTAWAVATDAQERIVVAGRTPGAGFTVARFLANGAADDGFGVGGTAQLPIETDDLGGGATDVVVQPDGRPVVGGSALLDGANAFTAARVLADGGAPTGGPVDEGTDSSAGEIGTGPGPAPVVGAPIANRQGATGRVTIRILSRRVTRRGVLVRVTWPRGTEGTAKARLWTRNKGILLGQRTVAVLRGTTSRRFRVPLNRRARRLLRNGTVLKVRATVRVTGLPAKR